MSNAERGGVTPKSRDIPKGLSAKLAARRAMAMGMPRAGSPARAGEGSGEAPAAGVPACGEFALDTSAQVAPATDVRPCDVPAPAPDAPAADARPDGESAPAPDATSTDVRPDGESMSGLPGQEIATDATSCDESALDASDALASDESAQVADAAAPTPMETATVGDEPAQAADESDEFAPTPDAPAQSAPACDEPAPALYNPRWLTVTCVPFESRPAAPPKPARRRARALPRRRVAACLSVAVSAVVALALALGTATARADAPGFVGASSSDAQARAAADDDSVASVGDDAVELASSSCRAAGLDAAAAQLGRVATLLDGCVVDAGATFSLVEHLNPADVDAEGAQMAASALYVAALEAGLRVDERHAAAVAPAFAPVGLDAAVGAGVGDLVVANPTDAPVRLAADASGRGVVVSVFGTGEAGVTREASSRVAGDATRTSAPLVPSSAADDPAEYVVVEAHLVTRRDGAPVSDALVSVDAYLLPAA